MSKNEHPVIEMFSIVKYGNALYEIVGGRDSSGDNPLTFHAEFIECLHEDAVKWNPYNKVVSCHRCGEIFESKVYNDE